MTTGAQLKKARQAKKLAFADVTRDTRIQGWVLEALEADQLHQQMSAIYAKGFLAQYAKFLGLDPAPLLAQLQSVMAPPPAPTASELPPPAAPAEPIKIEVPWPAIRHAVRQAAPAFAAVAVVALLIVSHPLQRLSKVSWPKMPAVALKMPSLPKLAFQLPKPQVKTAKAPASKKLVAKPATKPAAAPKPLEELARMPATEPGAPRDARGGDGSAAAGVRLRPLPEPQLTITPRTASMTPLPVETAPKLPALPTLQMPATTKPLELVLVATRPTWVQVRADGKLLAERRLPSGSKERWTAKKSLDVIVAQPELELSLNGQNLIPFVIAYRGRLHITRQGVTRLPAESE